MLPGSTKGGGECLAAPDVCITQVPPPVVKAPIPYPNTAMLMQATKTSTKVKFSGKEVLTTKSEIPRSMGDEAGTDKGTMSGTTMDKVVFKKGSSKVKAEGQPCIQLTSLSAHNGSNANAPSGCQVAPSQTNVLLGL